MEDIVYIGSFRIVEYGNHSFRMIETKPSVSLDLVIEKLFQLVEDVNSKNKHAQIQNICVTVYENGLYKEHIDYKLNWSLERLN